LYQDNVPLEQGQTYEVSFDAKSTIDRKIIVQLQRNGTSDNNWDSYFYQEVELTNELKTFKYDFALGNTENKTYAPHEIIIDNVVVRKVATPSALILNGTFDDGMEHWGELEINITKVGTADYMPQIKQENIALQEGVTYTLSLKARALEARSIKVDILDSSYNWYGGTIFDLTTEDAVYTFTFTQSKSINNGVLTINLGTIEGKTSAATTVYWNNSKL